MRLRLPIVFTTRKRFNATYGAALIDQYDQGARHAYGHARLLLGALETPMLHNSMHWTRRLYDNIGAQLRDAQHGGFLTHPTPAETDMDVMLHEVAGGALDQGDRIERWIPARTGER